MGNINLELLGGNNFMVVLCDEAKIVYIDGPLSGGVVRSIRGKIVNESEKTITIQRADGQVTIGKNFIVKIEKWREQ